jgi:hypothetical protein
VTVTFALSDGWEYLGCVWLRSVEEWSGSILDSKSRMTPFLCLVERTEPSYFLFG